LGLFGWESLGLIFGRGRSQTYIFLIKIVVSLSDRLLYIEWSSIVLQCTSPFPIRRLLLRLKVHVIQFLIVDTSQIIIMEGNMSEFRPKDIHFTPILKDNFVVEMNKCFFSWFNFSILDECFPNFSFLEDQYFDNHTVGTENLV
jgi:uncharacterized protein YhhL (DUF1145 family)